MENWVSGEDHGSLHATASPLSPHAQVTVLALISKSAFQVSITGASFSKLPTTPPPTFLCLRTRKGSCFCLKACGSYHIIEQVCGTGKCSLLVIRQQRERKSQHSSIFKKMSMTGHWACETWTFGRHLRPLLPQSEWSKSSALSVSLDSVSTENCSFTNPSNRKYFQMTAELRSACDDFRCNSCELQIDLSVSDILTGWLKQDYAESILKFAFTAC